MKLSDQLYSSYKTPRNIKEGMAVLFVEKGGSDAGIVTIARIANITQVQDDCKFNLIDDETGKYILKENGDRRAWMLKAALRLGTILVPESGELKICPSCRKNFLDENQAICQDCIREEKKSFFATKVKMNGKPFFLDDEQTDAVLAASHSLVTARAGSGKTRVLTAKLIDLFFNQGIKEDEVLAFCFNRDAADEIRRRLNSECTINGLAQSREYNIVNTFHAYTEQIGIASYAYFCYNKRAMD